MQKLPKTQRSRSKKIGDIINLLQSGGKILFFICKKFGCWLHGYISQSLTLVLSEKRHIQIRWSVRPSVCTCGITRSSPSDYRSKVWS